MDLAVTKHFYKAYFSGCHSLHTCNWLADRYSDIAGPCLFPRRPAFSCAMKPPRFIFTKPTASLFIRTPNSPPNSQRLPHLWPSDIRFRSWKRPQIPSAAQSSSTAIAPEMSSGGMEDLPEKAEAVEGSIEKVKSYGVAGEIVNVMVLMC